MKLATLEVENFRKFKHKKFSFKESTTIICGDNASGKSTVLDGIDLLFFNILQNAGGEKVNVSKKINDIDVKYGSLATSVIGTIRIENEYFKVNFNHTLKRKSDFYNVNNNYIASESFRLKYLLDEDENMPIYASYNIENISTLIKTGSKNNHFEKISVIDNKGSENFFKWIKWAMLDNKDESRRIEKIKEVIYNYNGEIRNIDFNNGKKINIDIRKEKLLFNQLSYSEKIQFVLVGDIGRRLYTANPSLNNPFLGTGVVVIDNLDMILDKYWNGIYLKNLISIFPKIQFLISTNNENIATEYGKKVNVINI